MQPWIRSSAITLAAIALGTGVGLGVMKATVPDPDELVERFNPELKARHFANKEARLKAMELNSQRMREWSRSDKPIWVVAKEAEEKERLEREGQKKRWKGEAEERRAGRKEGEGEEGVVQLLETVPIEEKVGKEEGKGTGWGLWAR